MARDQQMKALASAHVTRDPRICGGEPIIAGTRVPVRAVAVSHQFYQDIARVQRAYPRLTMAAVQAALDYYAAHRDEIDRLIEENERAIAAAD